ncbi:uncharacterized protein TNCV_136011 [Trichonephila clavipes]|nr:uncharacterized protein TNCV_136011 [Trichonephila clavipes]
MPLARDDQHLLRMAMNDRTASSRQLAARWPTATVVMSNSSAAPWIASKGAFIQDSPHATLELSFSRIMHAQNIAKTHRDAYSPDMLPIEHVWETVRNRMQKKRQVTRKKVPEVNVSPHLRSQILALPVPTALPPTNEIRRNHIPRKPEVQSNVSTDTSLDTPEQSTPMQGEKSVQQEITVINHESEKPITEASESPDIVIVKEIRRNHIRRKPEVQSNVSTDTSLDTPEQSTPMQGEESVQHEITVINHEFEKPITEASESPDIVIVKEIRRNHIRRKPEVQSNVSTDTSLDTPEQSTPMQGEGLHSERVAEKVEGMITQNGKDYLVVKW